ncbi:MAG TPA: hypothetical protein VLA12_01695 [Planctomycetaceae bacterium]|nr:hypothetical protein [Planctomycetaceae bacterium]
MPIVVECDSCGKKYRVGDHQAGSYLPCKQCGAEMFVFDGRGGRAGTSRGGAEGVPPWVIKVSVGAGVVIVLLIVGMMFMGGGDNDDRPREIASSENQDSNGNPVPPTIPGDRVGSEYSGRATNPRPGLLNPGNTNPVGNNANAGQGNNAASPFQRVRPGANQPDAENQTPIDDLKSPFERVKEMEQEARGAFGQNRPSTVVNSRPPAGWSVQSDPMPAELAYDFTTKLKKMEIDLGSASRGDVYFPKTASPYVAIGGKGHTIYDVRTGRRVKKTDYNPGFRDKSTLSPGAKYIGGTYGTFGNDGIGLWDIKKDEALGAFEYKGVEQIMFSTDERLVALTDKKIVVFESSTGKELGSIELDDGPFGAFSRIYSSPSAMTPGGRYLATFSIKSGIDSGVNLNVFDLVEYKHVGKLDAPEKQMFAADAEGVAFSQDGQHLAALIATRDQGRLLVWNFLTGQLENDFNIKENWDSLHDASWRGTAWSKEGVNWFPDKQRLVVLGHGVVDREVGEIVYILPPATSGTSHRWPINNSQVVALVGDIRTSGLATVDLPVELFDKARETIQAGGLAIDTLLPPLTQADINAMAPLQAPPAQWAGAPDPAPSPMPGLLSKTLEFELPTDEGYFSQLFLSDASSGRIAICRKTQAQRWRQYGEPIVFQAWIDTYELVRGKEAQRSLELPYPADAIAFSPSGKYILTRDAERQDRLDMWNVTDRTHRLGFRPYNDQTGESFGNSGRSDYGETVKLDRQIIAGRFLDDNHLVTLSGKRRLRVWKLPECRAVYELQEIGVPGISPGGNLIVVHADDRLMVYDARTGEPKGSMIAPGEMKSAGFHTNGELVAITVVRGADNFLYAWNLRDGLAIAEFPLPQLTEQLRFADENHVLLDGNMLVNLQREAVAWNYLFPEEAVIPFGLDDRIIYYGPHYGRKPSIYLTAAKLPEDAVRQKIESSRLSGEFIPLAGKTVSVEANVENPPDTQNYRTVIVDHFQKALQAVGATPAAQGRYVLSLQTQEGAGRSATFVTSSSRDPFSGSGLGSSLFRRPEPQGEQQANIRSIVCSIKISEDGLPNWKTQRTYSNYSFFVMIQAGSSLQQELDKGLWSSVKRFFETALLPTFVFPPGADQGLGRTTLNDFGQPVQ